MRRAVALALVGSCLASRVALGADAGSELVPAEMLLELDVLSDDRFVARPGDRDHQDTAPSVEALDDLDWPDPEDDAGMDAERESVRRKR